VTSAYSPDRAKLFSDLKAEVYKRQLSNSENFDKSVLTYAVAGLGLSLGFLKDFVPITKAAHAWMLYSSWALLVAAVVLTMASFLLSQAGLKKQLAIAERYYLQEEESALKELNSFSSYTEQANLASGLSFLLGLALTTLFVAINLTGAAEMKDQPKPPTGTPLGATIPDLQRVQQPDFTRGAPVPTIQPVPPAPAPAPAAPPAPPPAAQQQRP
jgi:hypothetical protein